MYVDDIIVSGNDYDEQKLLKENLARVFDIKDLGRLRCFLGIEVAYSKEGIFLSQRQSTTGYYVFLAGNLVPWRSKKRVVARSSAEAKFQATTFGLWLM